MLPGELRVIGEAAHLFPGPEGAEGGVGGIRRGLADIEGLGVGSPVAGDPAQRYGAFRLAAPFPDQGKRAVCEEIGELRGLERRAAEALAFHRDPRQHRAGDRIAETPDRILCLRGIRHHETLVPGDVCEAFDEVAVDAAADAKRKHVGALRAAADELEGLRLRVDKAVGDEDERAGNVLFRGQGDGGLQTLDEFRAAPAAVAREQGDGFFDVRGICRKRGRGEHLAIAGEEHDIERVGGPQAADEFMEKRLRQADREAVHRARDIDEENVVAGRDVALADRCRRLDLEQEEIFVLPFMQQQAGSDFLIRQPVAHDEIPVRRGGGESQGGAALVEVGDLRIVLLAGEGAQRQRGGDLQVHREARWGFPGIPEMGVCGECLRLALAGVARPDGGGQDEFVGAVHGLDELAVAQGQRDHIAGHDAGDFHLEEVGALLAQQAGGLVLRFGFLELPFCLCLLPDLGRQHPLADGHRHPVHRRPRGGGEKVGRVDGSLAVVRVGLGQGDLRDGSGDRDLRVAILQREDIRPVISVDLEIGGGGFHGYGEERCRRDREGQAGCSERFHHLRTVTGLCEVMMTVP